MKKSLMILACAAVAASAMAQDVVSKNIVGFGQATVSPGFWLVGCNFQDMSASDAVSIQGLFPAEELYADPDGNPDISDRIMPFDGVGYTIYYFCNFGNLGDPQWYDEGFGDPVVKNFARGDGFWYSRAEASSATTLTIMGQVPTNSTYTHPEIAEGFIVIANAYPNETSLNSLGINAYANPDGNPDTSDRIMTFDGVGYTIYYFCNFGNSGDPQWYDEGFGDPLTLGLKVGQGAWYSRSAEAVGNGTWTEAKPY